MALTKVIGAGLGTTTVGTTITTADNTDQLTLISTDADASTGPNLVLQRDSASPADNDLAGTIKFIADNDAAEATDCVSIFSKIIDASNGSEDASLLINSIVGGSQISRFNITPTEIAINEDSADIDFRVESNGNASMLFVDGGQDIVSIGGSASYTVGGFKNTLQLDGVGADGASISITRNNANANPPYLQFAKSRGTSAGSNTIVQDDDELARIVFNAADGTNRDTPAAEIRCSVDGTPGENDMPGRITFHTTDDGGSSTTQRMVINSSGDVGIGTTTTAAMLNVRRNSGDIAYFQNNAGTGAKITAGNNSFSTVSDENKKENITELTKQDSYDNIKNIKAVNYNYKSVTITNDDGESETIENKQKRLGFIAQDWKTKYPESITTDDDGTLNLHYTDTIAVILSALQKAQEKIDTLEAKVKVLEG